MSFLPAFLKNLLWAICLTVLVVLVHGFHPAAEDGGIYTAGVYLKLDPTLFPHDAAFVRAPTAYSSFADLILTSIRLLHVSTPWVFFGFYCVTVGVAMLAAQGIARHCGFSLREQRGAMALLATWWTLPVAGTSLNIADPYLTARSFSTPLSLWAVSLTLEFVADAKRKRRWTSLLLCAVFLGLTAAMHRLMVGFTAMFLLLLLAQEAMRWWIVCALSLCTLVIGCIALQTAGGPESSAFLQSELTRQYWFLAEWRWFEWLGLVAPLLIFAAYLRASWGKPLHSLCRTALLAGVLSMFAAIFFAREHASTHLVARLQPLRMFMLLHALMATLLGGALVRCSERAVLFQRGPVLRKALVCVPAIAALMLFSVQRIEYSSSNHVEWPWLSADTKNPWVAAFAWCRMNTPPDALFALDSAYIHAEHEDGQTFRAIARRSALPDQSKDGGEAAVDADLADRWKAGMDAQTDLDKLNDVQKKARLQPLGVSWMVLTSADQTDFVCPYSNTFVRVCKLPRKD